MKNLLKRIVCMVKNHKWVNNLKDNPTRRICSRCKHEQYKPQTMFQSPDGNMNWRDLIKRK